MTDRDTPQGALEDLISRVEKCTGPDAALALDLMRYLIGDGPLTPEQDPGGIRFQVRDHTVTKWLSEHGDPTASLDAVVALVDREFPEQTNPWVVRQMLGAQWYIAEIELSEDCDGGTGEGKTPALALLLAFLKAKHAQAT